MENLTIKLNMIGKYVENKEYFPSSLLLQKMCIKESTHAPCYKRLVSIYVS